MRRTREVWEPGVDVLTQPSVRKVGAGKGGAADEVDAIAEIAAEKAEQIRDQVVSFELFGGDPELLCYCLAFVDVHCRAQVSARCSDARRRCFLTDEAAVADVLAAVPDRLDGVVHAAGVAGGGPVHTLDRAEWDRVIGINLTGTFLVAKAALARMI